MSNALPRQRNVNFNENNPSYWCCCGKFHLNNVSMVISIALLIDIVWNIVGNGMMNFAVLPLSVNVLGFIFLLFVFRGFTDECACYILPYLGFHIFRVIYMIYRFSVISFIDLWVWSVFLSNSVSEDLEQQNNDTLLLDLSSYDKCKTVAIEFLVTYVFFGLYIIAHLVFFCVLLKCCLYFRDKQAANARGVQV